VNQREGNNSYRFTDRHSILLIILSEKHFQVSETTGSLTTVRIFFLKSLACAKWLAHTVASNACQAAGSRHSQTGCDPRGSNRARLPSPIAWVKLSLVSKLPTWAADGVALPPRDGPPALASTRPELPQRRSLGGGKKEQDSRNHPRALNLPGPPVRSQCLRLPTTDVAPPPRRARMVLSAETVFPTHKRAGLSCRPCRPDRSEQTPPPNKTSLSPRKSKRHASPLPKSLPPNRTWLAASC
jgi:hypothetical protein